LRSQRYINPVVFVLAGVVAHDTKELFSWLGVAYEERCVQLPYLLRSAAMPQSDPRLIEMLRLMKLPTNP